MKNNDAVRYTILLALTGVLITALIGYVLNNTHNTYKRNLPYVKLGDYLKNTTTKAHLWFEEALSGDESISYEKDVLKLLTDSRGLLQKAMDGEETEIGKFWKTDDEETLAILKQSIIDVENFIEAANSRWESNKNGNSQVVEEVVVEEIAMDSTLTDSTATDSTDAAPVEPTAETDTQNAGAGGDLDQQFDASYENLQATFGLLVDHVSKKVNADSNFLVFLSWITGILIFGIFVALSFLVYRLLNRNQKLATDSKAKLEEELNRVGTLSEFIEAVSRGNYSISINATDSLTERLISMRDTLRNKAEEDERRNWATTGLAQIGEILRASDNINTLYDNIITFVVKYTKSNQGGLFLVNEETEEDHFLELVSCYAFERKKFITKRVELGQGLIGQCYHEGARIHLREIPEEYVTITSGLGGSNPTSLIVIPMRVNDKVYGVIELASFKEYQDFEIELVEKFAESIGASVSSIRINDNTRLLLEKTQQQTEEMRAQEEEMRQNMEELEATQEEMRRKERHVQDLLDAEKNQNEESKKLFNRLSERERVLALTTILSEADGYGAITYVNDKLCEVSKFTREELMGKGHNIFRHPDMPPELFKILWDTIKNQKKVFRGIVKNRAKDGTHYWVDATIVPILENGVFVKYISSRYHITNDQLALTLYNKQAEKLGLSLLSA
jgi:PAS domain S-box-containing protein